MTEYELRKRLSDDAGIGVSHGQLVRWRDRGLIAQADDGLWPPGTFHRVMRIHELGKTVRSEARRVILLNAEWVWTTPSGAEREETENPSGERIEVPPPALQIAMAEVAPTIRPHLKKMRRVDAAVVWWAHWAARPDSRRDAKLPRGWRSPPIEEWSPLLLSTPPDVFGRLVGLQYHLRTLIQTFATGTKYDLHDIPVEEQVVLLTIRELAAQERIKSGRNKSEDSR